MDERDLVGGSGCSDKVALTEWTGQAVNIGRASLENGAGFQVFCLKVIQVILACLPGEWVAAGRSGGKRRGESCS